VRSDRTIPPSCTTSSRKYASAALFDANPLRNRRWPFSYQRTPHPVLVLYAEPLCSAGIAISFLFSRRMELAWSIGPSAPGCEPMVDLGAVEADDIRAEDEAGDLAGAPPAQHARGRHEPVQVLGWL
jgi:hypothetical protein